MRDELFKQLIEKYEGIGEDPVPYLKGLLYAKPVSYWDYIELETLLSIQKPRTEVKDETVFILYHQITELVFKMILHEVTQITASFSVSDEFLIEKVKRLSRYANLLISSFDILGNGLDPEQFRTFRNALIPASGFQSVQFRKIEINCTRLDNLLGRDFAEVASDGGLSIDDYFDQMYWIQAAYHSDSGEKTVTFREFEKKYLGELKELALAVSGNTVEDKLLSIKHPSMTMKETLLEFDLLFNVEWPSVHLNMARRYLCGDGLNQRSTGSSDWVKFLDPQQQQRRFFPTLGREPKLELNKSLKNGNDKQA